MTVGVRTLGMAQHPLACYRTHRMARVAIISDVHADLHALQDALGMIDALGCDRVVCAGDLVDYGLFPEEALLLVRERKILCVRGNHDRWAVSSGGSLSQGQDGVGVDATSCDLSQAALDFLGSLPPTLRIEIDGTRFLVVHARPGSDMNGIYEDEPSSTVLDGWFEDCKADVLVVGHTHAPLMRRADSGGLVLNPGTLMREARYGPEGGPVFDPAAGRFVRRERELGTFGVFDTETRDFRIMRPAGHRSTERRQ
jgi:putative phosphoesterase